MSTGPRREGPRSILRTTRLELIPAPPAVVEAVLAGHSGAAGARRGLGGAPDGRSAGPAVRGRWPIRLRAFRADPAPLGWRIRLIVLRGERRAIGAVDLNGPPGPDGTVDVGWSLAPEYRGRGFATEAARAVLGWALAQPGVARVTARIQPENLASIRVAEHLGMHRTHQTHPEQGEVWEVTQGQTPPSADHRVAKA